MSESQYVSCSGSCIASVMCQLLEEDSREEVVRRPSEELLDDSFLTISSFTLLFSPTESGGPRLRIVFPRRIRPAPVGLNVVRAPFFSSCNVSFRLPNV